MVSNGSKEVVKSIDIYFDITMVELPIVLTGAIRLFISIFVLINDINLNIYSKKG